MRTAQEEEVGSISREVYESFASTSYTLSQLNISRQTIDDWIRFELETEHKREHCCLIEHEPTNSIVGLMMHKSYATMTLPLPNELEAIAPRYYLLQEIHVKFTNQLGLDTSRTVYADFGFINERHQGRQLSVPLDEAGRDKYIGMGYTGIIGEVSNPYLLRHFNSMGIKILEELNAADFEFNGTRPFMRDIPMTVYYRELGSPPKL